MVELCSYSTCTGCGACQTSCIHHAIDMEVDKFGFKYPKVNKDKCIDCKSCILHCPILTPLTYNYPQKAIACYALDKGERERSSSGGLATLLAKNIINEKGVVYGCAFVPPFDIRHIRCTKEEDLEQLRGSKYVQSDIINIYDDIKKDLKSGLKVLFIGTPCQVAAVKSISNKAKNLYTIDIICHGTPSLKFLLNTLPENIKKEPIKQIKFRDNSIYHFSLNDKNDNCIYERPLSNDIYMKGFFNGTIFRTSCFSCRFARRERVSDITLGDFWGIKSNQISNKEKGVSLALINNVVGQELFDDACIGKAYIEQRSLEEAFSGNEQLNHPFPKTFRVPIFRKLYPYMGYTMALCCALPDKMLAMKLKNLLK